MVSDVTTSGTLQNAQQTNQQSVTLAEDFSDFLTLLTTQLQNQDPLAPMDSTEFTNQLVQFSQVEQQINSNQKLDNMLQLQLAGQSSVGINYVGLDISYISAEANFNGTDPVVVNYSLSDPAFTAKLNIRDEAGDIVFSIDAPKDVGRNEITWNGQNNGGDTVPEGTYTITIDAVDQDDDPIQVSTAVSGEVRGIETQNGVVFLLVGERAVPISNVLQARVPDEPDPPANSGGSNA